MPPESPESPELPVSSESPGRPPVDRSLADRSIAERATVDRADVERADLERAWVNLPIDGVLLPKAERLRDLLSQVQHPIVAFSGGVDSAVVAAMVGRTHGRDCLLVTADSPSLSARQREIAARVAEELQLPHRWLATAEADDPLYQRNHRDRCYFCKTHLYTSLRQVATEFPHATVLSGTNYDDLGDYRPGLLAAAQNQVFAPLAEAQMGKADVRALARALGLSVHDLPAAPCLASRLAYGVAVTPERLRRVELAEQRLWQAGFSDVRVRLLPEEVGRVEVPLAEVPRLTEATGLLQTILQMGFLRVDIDPQGLRSGNLNYLNTDSQGGGPHLPIL